MRLIKKALMLSFAVFLSACASLQTNVETKSNDLSDYKFVVIQSVKVYSKEAAAAKNDKLQVKLNNWNRYAEEELNKVLSAKGLEVVTSMPEITESMLVIDFDVNVTYGNRALRWVGGIGGAGKGGVVSSLKVSDAKSGSVKFKAGANSDLAMGGGGGDMGVVVKDNIKGLLKQF